MYLYKNSRLPNSFQCSPYQAVTSKIYRLKQHFLQGCH